VDEEEEREIASEGEGEGGRTSVAMEEVRLCFRVDGSDEVEVGLDGGLLMLLV